MPWKTFFNTFGLEKTTQRETCRLRRTINVAARRAINQLEIRPPLGRTQNMRVCALIEVNHCKRCNNKKNAEAWLRQCGTVLRSREHLQEATQRVIFFDTRRVWDLQGIVSTCTLTFHLCSAAPPHTPLSPSLSPYPSLSLHQDREGLGRRDPGGR